MKLAVILPAAGLGKRFAEQAGQSAKQSKIELNLAGKPVFMHAVELFAGRPQVAQIILAVNPDELSAFKFKYGDHLALRDVLLVAGGKTERWETVLKAIEAVDASVTHIAVHDAARPITDAALIDRVLAAAQTLDAVIPGVAVNGTLKRVKPAELEMPEDPLGAILGDAAAAPPLAEHQVVQTVDRSHLVEVQTPQVFAAPLLRRAYDLISQGKLDAAGVTDDASLIEAMGEPVYVVDADMRNIKITRPADLELVELLARAVAERNAAKLGAKRLFGDDEEDDL